ncbi:4-hydroxy-tetrahydrodipicolinate reductase [Bacteroidota bacterium]
MENKKTTFIEPKIALIGYGSMGREIEITARRHNIRVTDIFEIGSKMSIDKKYEFDVAIDFSYPEFVLENIKILAGLKKNIVMGTTGWYDKMNEIKQIVNDSEVGCIYGSNFSIGMQMYFKIVEFASKLTDKFPEYDLMLHEMHHKRKKDSPSGSALTIADIILKNVNSKKEIFTDKMSGVVSPGMLHVSSTRGGEITGTHSVIMDSPSDTIDLIHRAKNRSGFASGAISAAEWIHGRKGFYQFNEMLEEVWKD